MPYCKIIDERLLKNLARTFTPFMKKRRQAKSSLLDDVFGKANVCLWNNLN
jgi:hypothetical protein